MADHNLKLSAEFFGPSERGNKPFEVRFNDRNYQAGHQLQEVLIIEGLSERVIMRSGAWCER